MKEIQAKKVVSLALKVEPEIFEFFPQEMEKSWGMFWFNSPQQHVSHEVVARTLDPSNSKPGTVLGGSSQDSDTWLITMVSKSPKDRVVPLPNGLNGL